MIILTDKKSIKKEYEYQCDTCGFLVDEDDYYANEGPCPTKDCKGTIVKRLVKRLG